MGRTTPAKSDRESRILFGQKRKRKTTTTTTKDWFPAVVHLICMSSSTFLAPSNFAVFLLPIFPFLLPIAKN